MLVGGSGAHEGNILARGKPVCLSVCFYIFTSHAGKPVCDYGDESYLRATAKVVCRLISAIAHLHFDY